MPICSGLDGECIDTSSRPLVLNVCFCKESNTNVVNNISFEANFRVLPSSPFDLIIGRKTIKQFKLGLLLPSHFFDEETCVAIRGATHPLSPIPIMEERYVSGERDSNSQASQFVAANAASERSPMERCGCVSYLESFSTVAGSLYGDNKKDEVDPGTQAPWGEVGRLVSFSGRYSPASPSLPSQTYPNFIAALVERELQSQFEAPFPDDDEIDYDKSDAFASFLKVDEVVGRNPYFPNNPL
jgi:hypothetical protein